MRTNRQQFYRVFFAASMLILLASGPILADNVYVSCWGGNTIKKFDSRGNMSIFASGLGFLRRGLAFDSSGNLYAVDWGSGTDITKFDSSGNGSAFGPGLGAEDIALDSRGNLYEACSDIWWTIYKVSPRGQVSMFADYPGPMGSGHVSGLACNSSDNLYVSFGSQITKFDSSGHQSIFASSLSVEGIAFDSSGNLYAACGSTIKEFDSNGNMSIFASGLSGIWDLACGSSGNIYAINNDSGTIEKFDSSGNMSIFASGLNNPCGIAVLVPEPTTILLLGLGGMALVRRRKR